MSTNITKTLNAQDDVTIGFLAKAARILGGELHFGKVHDALIEELIKGGIIKQIDSHYTITKYGNSYLKSYIKYRKIHKTDNVFEGCSKALKEIIYQTYNNKIQGKITLYMPRHKLPASELVRIGILKHSSLVDTPESYNTQHYVLTDYGKEYISERIRKDSATIHNKFVPEVIMRYWIDRYGQDLYVYNTDDCVMYGLKDSTPFAIISKKNKSGKFIWDGDAKNILTTEQYAEKIKEVKQKPRKQDKVEEVLVQKSKTPIESLRQMCDFLALSDNAFTLHLTKYNENVFLLKHADSYANIKEDFKIKYALGNVLENDNLWIDLKYENVKRESYDTSLISGFRSNLSSTIWSLTDKLNELIKAIAEISFEKLCQTNQVDKSIQLMKDKFDIDYEAVMAPKKSMQANKLNYVSILNELVEFENLIKFTHVSKTDIINKLTNVSKLIIDELNQLNLPLKDNTMSSKSVVSDPNFDKVVEKIADITNNHIYFKELQPTIDTINKAVSNYKKSFELSNDVNEDKLSDTLISDFKKDINVGEDFLETPNISYKAEPAPILEKSKQDMSNDMNDAMNDAMDRVTSKLKNNNKDIAGVNDKNIQEKINILKEKINTIRQGLHRLTKEDEEFLNTKHDIAKIAVKPKATTTEVETYGSMLNHELLNLPTDKVVSAAAKEKDDKAPFDISPDYIEEFKQKLGEYYGINDKVYPSNLDIPYKKAKKMGSFRKVETQDTEDKDGIFLSKERGLESIINQIQEIESWDQDGFDTCEKLINDLDKNYIKPIEKIKSLKKDPEEKSSHYYNGLESTISNVSNVKIEGNGDITIETGGKIAPGPNLKIENNIWNESVAINNAKKIVREKIVSSLKMREINQCSLIKNPDLDILEEFAKAAMIEFKKLNTATGRWEYASRISDFSNNGILEYNLTKTGKEFMKTGREWTTQNVFSFNNEPFSVDVLRSISKIFLTGQDMYFDNYMFIYFWPTLKILLDNGFIYYKKEYANSSESKGEEKYRYKITEKGLMFGDKFADKGQFTMEDILNFDAGHISPSALSALSNSFSSGYLKLNDSLIRSYGKELQFFIDNGFITKSTSIPNIFHITNKMKKFRNKASNNVTWTKENLLAFEDDTDKAIEDGSVGEVDDIKYFQTQSSKKTFGQIMKSNAIDASYRVAATQSNKLVTGLIVNTLHAQGTDNDTIVNIASFLDTELGGALISMILGSTLHYLPKVGDDTRIQRLCEELRIGAMATTGNMLATEIIQNLLPAMAGVIDKLPALETGTGARIEVDIKSEDIAPSTEIVSDDDQEQSTNALRMQA